jgi:hypothetical protein
MTEEDRKNLFRIDELTWLFFFCRGGIPLWFVIGVISHKVCCRGCLPVSLSELLLRELNLRAWCNFGDFPFAEDLTLLSYPP